MKYLFYPILAFLLFSCSQSNETTFSYDNIEVSGEFLFEGPNSLQGPLVSPIDKISEEKGINASEIEAVYVSNCTVEFNSEDKRKDLENMLVQLVSEKLNLISVATINGIPQSGDIVLSSSAEQDILPYLKDPNTTLVVDANLKKDMDELTCLVNLELKILY